MRRDAECLAARREDANLAAAAEQLLDGRCDRLEEVLAVVEHEHGLSIREHRDDGAETCYTCRLPIRIGDRCSRCAQEAEP